MKRHTPAMQPLRSRENAGAALIIVLLFLVMITTLSVAYMTSSTVERSAASSHLEKSRATTLARQGLESAVATLQRETSDLSRNWISQPGMLTVPDAATTNKTILKNSVYLSSGSPSPEFLHPEDSADPALLPPDLNSRTFDSPNSNTYLIVDPPLVTPSTGGSNTAPSAVGAEMKVRWVYVRADGSTPGLDPSRPISKDNLPDEKPDLTDKTNPIVGRFAYWADDESSKVNYNLAWLRNPAVNKNPAGHPTNINLTALPNFTTAIANKLHSSVTPDNYYASITRFFNSPFDARLVADDSTRAVLNANKFNLTHYNHDPDTTYYGKSRMVLTTQLANAVIRDDQGNIVKQNGKPLTRPYLDILKRVPDDNTTAIDPGLVSSIDGTKLNNVIRDLVDNYLKKSDWPMVDGTGHSVQEKYYSKYSGVQREQRLAQIALNIIDYVRSAESRLWVVEPIRGKYVNGNFVGDFTDTSLRGQEDTFKGLVRAPYITEMGVWMSNTAETTGPNKGRYRTFGFVEIYLPQNCGIDSLDLLAFQNDPLSSVKKAWTLYFKEFGRGSYYIYNGSAANVEYSVSYRATRDLPPEASQSPVFVWDAVGNQAKTKMLPGEYRTLAMEVWRAPTRPTTVMLRSAFTLSGGARIDVAPLGDPGSTSPTSVPRPLVYALDAGVNPADPLSEVSSYETADPRVNGVASDWIPNDKSLLVRNTFSAVNNAWKKSVGKPPINVTPLQDLDVAGTVSNASFRMPYPSGNVKNPPPGRVRSSGELGLIHTGIEGSSTVGSGGVPWRSLHLQPSSQATDVVPDWAFMDLFTVPADVPAKASVLFSPHGSSTGGRVNMNAEPQPSTFSLNRVDPLAAVLTGCRVSWATNETLTPAKARQIADNIYHRVTAKAGKLPAGKAYPKNSGVGSTPNVYDSPGEVVEIEGVANGGEESELLVNEIANLITARGNVFSVYTIGQALKQTANGKLIVTGEQRQQAMVERYLIDKNTSTPTDDVVGFRTLYFRNLNP